MQKKQGISLIVLVITIIVMIILAASVVITLSNTGVIDRASEAVDLTNEASVQDLAALTWADAYMDNLRGQDLIDEVTTKLSEQGVTETNWNITVTDTGISVTNKNSTSGTTLGSLVTAADYGKTVNYEANGVTDWKVFYEDETNGYVYLIASEKLAYDKVPTKLTDTLADGGAGATISSSTITLADNTTRTVGQIYWGSAPTSAATIQNTTIWMANWSDYTTNENGRCVSYFLDETYWTGFKNTDASYASYVLGAIGTPTAEMFVASWNAKRATETNTDKVELTLTGNGTTGYYVNGSDYTSIATTDNLYIWSTASNSSTWLASPPGYNSSYLLYASNSGYVDGYHYNFTYLGVRPVVCLKSNIPAVAGTTTDFEI